MRAVFIFSFLALFLSANIALAADIVPVLEDACASDYQDCLSEAASDMFACVGNAKGSYGECMAGCEDYFSVLIPMCQVGCVKDAKLSIVKCRRGRLMDMKQCKAEKIECDLASACEQDTTWDSELQACCTDFQYVADCFCEAPEYVESTVDTDENGCVLGWGCECVNPCGPEPQCDDGIVVDTNDDGCGDTCQCLLAIDCMPGYMPEDTSGDGCDDSCKSVCEEDEEWDMDVFACCPDTVMMPSCAPCPEGWDGGLTPEYDDAGCLVAYSCYCNEPVTMGNCMSDGDCKAGEMCTAGDDCMVCESCPMCDVCCGVCIPECPGDACGPAPGMPNFECPDGTMAGPVCEKGADGCGWTIKECPVTDLCKDFVPPCQEDKDCNEGEVCAQEGCNPSTCSCDPETGGVMCTADCAGKICVPDDGPCPPDQPPVSCLINPCEVTQCEAYPNALCEANYCGGCNADYYVDGELVDCEQKVTCEYGGMTYAPGDSFSGIGADWCNSCFCDELGGVACTEMACGPEPCESNDQCKEEEFCASDLCGNPGQCVPKPSLCTMQYDPVCGCDGETYSNACVANSNGAVVESWGECKPEPGGCTSDADCPADAWCREVCDSQGTLSECVPYVGVGEYCSGFVPFCALNKCEPGLECSPQEQDPNGPIIMDLPGICTDPNAGGCPDGSAPVQCFVNPCDNAICPANDKAECEPNYCGGCFADFYENGELVDCYDFPVQCESGGETHAVGDSFPGEGDNWCNTCTCMEGGEIACTKMACPAQGCEQDGVMYEVGESFPGTGNNWCNTCFCGDDGAIACTLMLCPPQQCEQEGVTYEDGEEFAGAGDNWCNDCWCDSGVIGCTKKACQETCTEDLDCSKSDWCRPTCENENVSVCVPFVPEGSLCGGYVQYCTLDKCDAGLTCESQNPMIPDLPGICVSNQAQGCEVGGVTYAEGESFNGTGDNWCNSCWCEGGAVACTKMGCMDNPCMVTGCSGHVCAPGPVNTTCEFKPEYACYSSVGNCGPYGENDACMWDDTDALLQCIDDSSGTGPVGPLVD